MRLLLIPILVIASCSPSSVDTTDLKSTGLRQYHNDSLQEAIKTFSIALKSNDTCWDCLLYRGFSYKETEELDKAIADFTSFINIYPNESGGYANRASVYYLKENYESSLTDYRKAYELDSSKIYLNPICHMLYATGKKDSACLIYTKLANLGDTSFDKGLVEYCKNYR